MAKVNGRRKGNSYELKVAKLLSSWWGAEFHRTPGSGSWSSTHNTDMQGGDIITPVTANFPFVVECKNQEQWTGDDIIFNRGKYPKFWEQVVNDAKRVNKIPMLIAHRNRSKNYVTVPHSNALMSNLMAKGLPVIMSYISYTNPLTDKLEEYTVLTTELESLMGTFSPQFFKDHAVSLFPAWIKEGDGSN